METMTPPPEKSKKQICSIRILFPVDTDEQAIEYKKKASTLFAEIPEANIQFSLISGQPAIK